MARSSWAVLGRFQFFQVVGAVADPAQLGCSSANCTVCAVMACSSARSDSSVSMAQGKRAQPASVRHGNRQRAALYARHRRLNNGQLDAEKILDIHAPAFFKRHKTKASPLLDTCASRAVSCQASLKAAQMHRPQSPAQFQSLQCDWPAARLGVRFARPITQTSDYAGKLQRCVQAGSRQRASLLPVRLPRDDDIGAARQGRKRGGNESQVLRPMMTGQPCVSRLKCARSSGKCQGDGVVLADHAVGGTRVNQADAGCFGHAGHTATGALMAGWC